MTEQRFIVLALRIHVSSHCKSLLDNIGGYHLEERGWTSMKVTIIMLVSDRYLFELNKL